MSIIRDGFQSADLDVPVVLPTLNLDFANSQELDPRITFSRGSTGTYFGPDGLMRTAGVNEPRFDHDPVTGQSLGLLIEESRTNLLTYSEDFSNAVWIKTNSSIQSNVITAPDGNTTADKLVENTTSNGHGLYYQITLPSTTTYTFSVFLKAGERSWVDIRGYNATNGNQFIAKIDLINGIFLSNTNTTNVKLDKYANGWWRFSGVGSFNNIYTQFFIAPIIRNNNASDTSYSGDGTSGIYIWGTQLEAGAFPTTYIPTGASTVTRSAELAEVTGTNFSSWYNQTEGTFFFDGTLPFITMDSVTSGARVPYGVSNGFNFANSMYVSKGNTSLGLSFSVINNNVAQTTGTSLSSMTSSRFKISSAFADKNIYSCGYGGTVNKNSKPSAAIPTVNRLTLGREPWNTSPLNPIIGCIRKFAYYPRALSPAQLQYLTQ